jgi:prepilin-type N-terminal cleavage/methylation domain-containing protein
MLIRDPRQVQCSGCVKMGGLARARGRYAFTLIELLVVIAIIALLIGILLPSLGSARESARVAKCLSNARGTGLSMTLYATDWKSWYPIMPMTATGRNEFSRQGGSLGSEQEARGGVAALFSLFQVGNGTNFGFRGLTPNPDDAAYIGGAKQPLLQPYVESFEILTCPSDKLDLYWGAIPQQGSRIADALARLQPKAPGKSEDVVSYNISYLYIAGMKTDEPVILNPAVLWGDETIVQDIATDAWYGAGGGTDNAAAGQTTRGFYGPLDNHKRDGGNYVFTDGHGAFLKGNVHDTFFLRPSPGVNPGPQSVNVIDRNRSAKTRTID